MKKFSRWVDKFCYNHPNFGINNLMMFVVVGNVLPASLTSALSVALFGMFLAVIIPPARKERVLAVLIAVSMASSYALSKIEPFASLSSGMRVIILTVVISAVAAYLFPVSEGEKEDTHAA